MKRIKTTLLATVSVALTFVFFACSTDDVKEWFDEPSSSSLEPSSSGGLEPSSSSSRTPSSSSRTPSSSSRTIESGILTDSRDGKTYKWVKIGTQTWMAENLNYFHEGMLASCYDTRTPPSCPSPVHSLLYDWQVAMDLPSDCKYTNCSNMVDEKHQGICPTGWHIPSDTEWTTLINYVGGIEIAGTELRDADDWFEYYDSYEGAYLKPTGTNSYGFKALPEGRYSYILAADEALNPFYSGVYGGWWSSTEKGSYDALNRVMFNEFGSMDKSDYDKDNFISVRCVKN